MSKELPYFRFTAFEWLNGDISLESYDIKGVFSDICAYYWFKDCSITKAMLEKRFSNALTEIKTLLKTGIIKYKNGDEFLIISFLDEQFDQLSELRKRRQEAGRKGGKQGLSKPKAKPKQKRSYKDKDNNNNKDNSKSESTLIIDKREAKFKSEVFEFADKYPETMLDKFCNYWTEKNPSKTKMKFELEKTFEISKRLVTWASRDNTFTKTDNAPKTYEEMLSLNDKNPGIFKQYKMVKENGKLMYYKND